MEPSGPQGEAGEEGAEEGFETGMRMRADCNSSGDKCAAVSDASVMPPSGVLARLPSAAVSSSRERRSIAARREGGRGKKIAPRGEEIAFFACGGVEFF